jgi:hypothetical protein
LVDFLSNVCELLAFLPRCLSECSSGCSASCGFAVVALREGGGGGEGERAPGFLGREDGAGGGGDGRWDWTALSPGHAELCTRRRGWAREGRRKKMNETRLLRFAVANLRELALFFSFQYRI